MNTRSLLEQPPKTSFSLWWKNPQSEDEVAIHLPPLIAFVTLQNSYDASKFHSYPIRVWNHAQGSLFGICASQIAGETAWNDDFSNGKLTKIRRSISPGDSKSNNNFPPRFRSILGGGTKKILLELNFQADTRRHPSTNPQNKYTSGKKREREIEKIPLQKRNTQTPAVFVCFIFFFARKNLLIGIVFQMFSFDGQKQKKHLNAATPGISPGYVVVVSPRFFPWLGWKPRTPKTHGKMKVLGLQNMGHKG